MLACCVSSLVCVVYIDIYKIGCNIHTYIHTYKCLLKENVSIDCKCTYITKMCLLNEKVPIDKKCAH